MNYTLVARNSEDPRESFIFHTTATLEEALKYREVKREIFRLNGGWYIEIESPEGTLIEETFELA